MSILFSQKTVRFGFLQISFLTIICYWEFAGGKPLLELNRVLRPGGYYIWSATPVYRQEKRDQDDWNGLCGVMFYYLPSIQLRISPKKTFA